MNEKLKSESILLDFLINKKWRVIRHILMLVILAINFYPNIDAAYLTKLNIENADLVIKGINNGTMVMFLMAVLLIYINLLMLIPELLLKNRYIHYFIACVVLAVFYFLGEYFILGYFIQNISEYIPDMEFSLKSFIYSTFIPLIFLCSTAGYKIFKKWIVDNRLLAQMREAKIQEELTNLKNQIKPHFLFNTLNNLNTLISTDPAKASAVVLGLSDVLRYQLYEANGNEVLLKKDIDILNQYLELEKIRRDNFQFGITVDGDISGVMIPPFIFINFVENAIKHSADNKGFSYIVLNFSIVNGLLNFNCKNSKSEVAIIKDSGGLGLQNIKRRLELMYPVTFELDIKDEANEFSVNLKLPI